MEQSKSVPLFQGLCGRPWTLRMHSLITWLVMLIPEGFPVALWTPSDVFSDEVELY